MVLTMVLTNNNIGVGSIVVADVHSAAATAAAAVNQFVKKKSAGAAVQCSGRIRPAARLRLARGESRKEWLTRSANGRTLLAKALIESPRSSTVDEYRDLAMREDLDRLAAEDDRRGAVAAVRGHDD